MAGKIRITKQEQKRLTTGGLSDPPKYTFGVLNSAVEYSGANKKELVGPVSEIYEEFREENPDGDFDDWESFYYSNYNGEKRIEEATEEAYEMFFRIREATKQIEKRDVNEFVRDLVLHSIYENRNKPEAIANKLDEVFDGECVYLAQSGDSMADAKINDQLVSFVEADSESGVDDDSVHEIEYLETSGGTITIDRSNLSRDLSDF